MRTILIISILTTLLYKPLVLSSPLSKIKYSPSIEAIYSSLDPKSISENLTFYKLYPESSFGKKAYSRAFELLTQGRQGAFTTDLPKIDISLIVNMVQKRPLEEIGEIEEKTLESIEKIGKNLGNRNFYGNSIWTKEQLLALPPEDIDLSRALFLTEFDYDLSKKKIIRYYEASIDLMALQILARLPKNASDKQKIRKINDFIFHEMQFRFPPHSLYAKNIDTYTFLPSVIDNRKGVCLGVSLLYQCIAQRLNLKLESITPPGHIYIRYVNGDKVINIETTARGIDLPTEQYLGIETIALQKRNMKELIGLAFMNQASVYWQKEDFTKAVSLYEKALLFIKDDALLSELYAYNLLFLGDKKGDKILSSLKNHPKRYLLSEKNILNDYLAGRTDAEGIKAIFMYVDETRDSILKKQKALEETTTKHPFFKAGLLQLASCHLQLLEEKKAMQILKRYFSICPDEPIINYYLSIIHQERMDYNKAWYHFHLLDSCLKSYDLSPKPLKNYKRMLMQKAPLFSLSSEKQNKEIASIEDK